VVYYDSPTLLNETWIQCLTPDISLYFDDTVDFYKDVFVAVNDFDGVFRPQAQYTYTYLRDYYLSSISPTEGYLT